MPTYEYHCVRCQQRYDMRRARAERNDPAPCPTCGTAGQRQLESFAYKYEGHFYSGHRGEVRRTDPHD
jgi:putative FmdB family regulatory protein